MTPLVATLYYRPPENLYHSPFYAHGLDIWAAGCTIAEVCLGEICFKGSNENDQLELIYKVLGIPQGYRKDGSDGTDGNLPSLTPLSSMSSFGGGGGGNQNATNVDVQTYFPEEQFSLPPGLEDCGFGNSEISPGLQGSQGSQGHQQPTKILSLANPANQGNNSNSSDINNGGAASRSLTPLLSEWKDRYFPIRNVVVRAGSSQHKVEKPPRDQWSLAEAIPEFFVSKGARENQMRAKMQNNSGVANGTSNDMNSTNAESLFSQHKIQRRRDLIFRGIGGARNAGSSGAGSASTQTNNLLDGKSLLADIFIMDPLRRPSADKLLSKHSYFLGQPHACGASQLPWVVLVWNIIVSFEINEKLFFCFPMDVIERMISDSEIDNEVNTTKIETPGSLEIKFLVACKNREREIVWVSNALNVLSGTKSVSGQQRENWSCRANQSNHLEREFESCFSVHKNQILRSAYYGKFDNQIVENKKPSAERF